MMLISGSFGYSGCDSLSVVINDSVRVGNDRRCRRSLDRPIEDAVACHLKQHDSGLQFSLDSLLARLDDEAGFDTGQRAGNRRAIHAPVTLGVMAGGYKPLYRGWATDLSPDGLGLLTEHDVPMGAVLYVNLETVAGKELLMPIRVCYVSQLMKHTYRVGGAFNFTEGGPGQARLSA
jgi:hypothetical protein